jgi:fructoselysine-6-P-deglycase FrlB-like protein
VATEGDEEIRRHADHLITIPDAPELFQPMLTVVPLQLLAYHAAVLRGHDVDKPRNWPRYGRMMFDLKCDLANHKSKSITNGLMLR